jgi:hypothetical protein
MILSKYENFTVDDFMALYDQIYKNVSASSRQSFKTALIRIETVYGSTLPELKLKWVEEKDNLISKMIDKDYSMNSILLTLNMILKLLKTVDAPIKNINDFGQTIQQINNRNKQKSIDQELTDKEVDIYVPWENILKTVVENTTYYLENDIDFIEFRNFVILATYVLAPAPVRIGNILNCTFIDGYTGHLTSLLTNNYIVRLLTNKYVFVFNKYKTAGKLGQQIMHIDSELLTKLYDKYFTDSKLNKQHYVFVPKDINGKIELIQSDVTLALHQITDKYFQKKFSVDMLRHSFITYVLSKDPSLKTKIDIAADMGQTYRINAQEYYRRT